MVILVVNCGAQYGFFQFDHISDYKLNGFAGYLARPKFKDSGFSAPWKKWKRWDEDRVWVAHRDLIFMTSQPEVIPAFIARYAKLHNELKEEQEAHEARRQVITNQHECYIKKKFGADYIQVTS